MARRPEEVFDEFFQRLGPGDRERYKGRMDLTGLSVEMRSYLATMREQIMTALLNEGKNVPEHADHPPFYFDYVESDISNALAFRYGDFSFVGITMPLLDELVATSKKVCGSDVILNILSPLRPPGQYEIKVLFATLVRLQLLFVLSHEYAHHVNGHLIPGSSGSVFSNEIVNSGEDGTLDQQVSEIDADGYATFIVLADLINGASRPVVINALKLDAEPGTVQDEVLFLCFVVAAVSFFYVRKPVVVENTKSVYQLTHPPQSVRRIFLMYFAVAWRIQFRPDVEVPGLETVEAESLFEALTMHYYSLMAPIATVTWGIESLSGWGSQLAFWASEDGGKYQDELAGRLGRLYPNVRKLDVRSLFPQPLSLQLTLLPAIDDPELHSLDYQRSLAGFADSLKSQNVEVSSHVLLREAIGLAAPLLGDFGIKLAVVAVPALSAAVGAWLHARYGRKVRLKIGEIEAEAQTVEEVEKLLKRAEEFQQRNKPKVIR